MSIFTKNQTTYIQDVPPKKNKELLQYTGTFLFGCTETVMMIRTLISSLMIVEMATCLQNNQIMLSKIELFNKMLKQLCCASTSIMNELKRKFESQISHC